MFDSLFGRVEREIDSLVWKHARRAMVAVPLIVAAIFATIVCSILAVETFGPVQGYGIMAGGFVVLSGLIAVFAYSGSGKPNSSSSEQKKEEPKSEREGRSEGLGFPPEALSLLTAVLPVALPRLARTAVRNLPTLAILAIIAFVLSLYSGGAKKETADADNGDHPDDVAKEPDLEAAETNVSSAPMAARAAVL